MRVPEPPKSLQALAQWVGVFSWILILLSFVISHISQPEFQVQYQDLNIVPLSAIQKGFGVPLNPLANGVQMRLLRVEVVNNKSSVGAKDVRVVVADYVRRLDFVMEQNGTPIQGYKLTASGNTSRLEIPIGYLPPRSQYTLFVGCQCFYIDFADVHAESSNLGISAGSQLGDLSGFPLFLGENADWAVILFLIVLGIALIARRKKVQ